MKTKTTAWNVAEHLKTKEEREAYLNAAFEDGDASVIAAALGDIAKAEGMSKVAKRTGLGRESLYKALSPDGNPALSTILKVIRAFEFNLRAACLYRHFGSDQSVWRDGDWNGFVRIALAGLLAPLIELAWDVGRWC